MQSEMRAAIHALHTTHCMGSYRYAMLTGVENRSKLLGGAQMRQQSRTSSARLDLDSQALAAFGAACVDHSAATFGFHAHEKAVGTGAAGFGGLIGTFHDLRVQLIPHQAEPTIIADFITPALVTIE